MSVEELKEKIIRTIEAIDNPDVVQYVYDLLQSELKTAEGHYKLTQKQLQIIEEARAQYRRGEFTTQEDMNKEIDEWLEE